MHLLAFCQLVCPENPIHDVLDFHTNDLHQNKYSVMTKSLEQTFTALHPRLEKSLHFENHFYRERLGLTIYMNFIEYLQLSIQDHKKQLLERVGENDEDCRQEVFTKDSDLKRIFMKPLLYNLDEYQDFTTNERIQQVMSSSIFFTILFQNEKRNEFGEFSFENCLRFYIRYLFSCEFYRMVKKEIQNCKSIYQENFILHVPTILYNTISFDSSLTIEKSIQAIEERFLKQCEAGICNIEYAIDPNGFVYDGMYHHLNYRDVQEEQKMPNMKKLKGRKVAYYCDSMKNEKKVFSMFDNMIDSWMIDSVYNMVRKYPLRSLEVKTIVSIFRSFFTGVTFKSVFVQYQQQRIHNEIRGLTNAHDMPVKNTFPKYFNNFKIRMTNRMNQWILDEFLCKFPLHRFNFNTMNSHLWYLINVIELSRFYKERNPGQLETFCGMKGVKLSGVLETENPSKVDLDYVMELLHERLNPLLLTPEEKSASFFNKFTKKFKEIFLDFFEKNVKKKLSLFEVRKELIRNGFQWKKDYQSDPFYGYFCYVNLGFFDRILTREIETMRSSYLIAGHEMFSEQWRSCLLCFTKTVGNTKENVREQYIFVIELLTGIKMDLVQDKEPLKAFQREMAEILKDESSYVYHNMDLDEYFFYNEIIHPYLQKNLISFIKFLKKVELSFFAQNNSEKNQRYEMEKVISFRVKLLLEKNLYKIIDQISFV